MSAGALQRLVEFMYCGELEVGGDVGLEELLGGAELLELPLASGAIEAFLRERLSVRTWAEARDAAGRPVTDAEAKVVDAEPTLDGWSANWGLSADAAGATHGWEKAADVARALAAVGAKAPKRARHE
jgi:hypothetical protein